MEKLTILYEDNQIVVAIKPQNVPTQADESGDGDMLSMVKAYVKEKYNKEGEAFIGLVHRLDRPTGGIMVFARNSKSAKRLTEQFKTHEVEKVYYAITNGVVKIKNQTLVNYVKKNEKENIVKIVPMGEQGAKKAELVYNVLDNNGSESLLEVKILTGRSHQIRLQLSNIGFPLVGDVKYGKATGRTGRLGLWAGKLSFVHPTTKQRMTFLACPDESVQPWDKFNMEKYLSR
ncbi:MAG: RluA family pseudouridine synthase [Clostridia bacterium]|nr:RluA family pseudouridine synthase [Clostridia bacterium]